MPKLRRSSNEIQDEILRGLAASTELSDVCKGCLAPTLRFAFPDTNNGSNWCVDAYPKAAPECLAFMKSATQALMLEYDMLD